MSSSVIIRDRVGSSPTSHIFSAIHPLQILLFDTRLEFWVYIAQGDHSPQKAPEKCKKRGCSLRCAESLNDFNNGGNLCHSPIVLTAWRERDWCLKLLRQRRLGGGVWKDERDVPLDASGRARKAQVHPEVRTIKNQAHSLRTRGFCSVLCTRRELGV